MFDFLDPEKEKPASALQCQKRDNPKGLISISQKYSKSRLIATFSDNGETHTIIAKGRNAQALRALVHRGENGITALEMSSWALRLGGYIFELRELGLRSYIITTFEKHDGGEHARYTLTIPVAIKDQS